MVAPLITNVGGKKSNFIVQNNPMSPNLVKLTHFIKCCTIDILYSALILLIWAIYHHCRQSYYHLHTSINCPNCYFIWWLRIPHTHHNFFEIIQNWKCSTCSWIDIQTNGRKPRLIHILIWPMRVKCHNWNLLCWRWGEIFLAGFLFLRGVPLRWRFYTRATGPLRITFKYSARLQHTCSMFICFPFPGLTLEGRHQYVFEHSLTSTSSSWKSVLNSIHPDFWASTLITSDVKWQHIEKYL